MTQVTEAEIDVVLRQVRGRADGGDGFLEQGYSLFEFVVQHFRGAEVFQRQAVEEVMLNAIVQLFDQGDGLFAASNRFVELRVHVVDASQLVQRTDLPLRFVRFFRRLQRELPVER